MTQSLDSTLAALPRRYPGPGGAAAVLKDGQVLEAVAWGYANAELRIPFTPHSLFRMCSVTKQFTCALLLDMRPDPAALASALRARLPHLEGPVPSPLHLAHNQSGLRDYWALAMLHGSPATAPFGDAEAARVIGRARTTQFTPGTQFSYSNGNFRLLSDLLEQQAGRPFASLLAERVLRPAGMDQALLAADTRALPDGTEGYEGSVEAGFRPAENRVVWTGDAGLAASLTDMIAWERYADAGRHAPDSLYARLAAPVHFADGSVARYGYGLARSEESGTHVTAHGGALRGWRCHRLYAAAERVSVVVMFNHMSDARQAALGLLAAILGATPAEPNPALPPPAWLGAYVDPDTSLSARLDMAAPGEVRLRYGHSAERLTLQPDGSARSPGVTLTSDGGGVLRMDRAIDHRSVTLQPWTGLPATAGVPGRYQCAEIDAELTVAEAGGTLYGAFSGFLGGGRMELLEPIGPDLWALPCPRALDHTPPGDWTMAMRRDGGIVQTITVGCWLAHGLTYARVG